jgi:cell division protein FtsW
VVAWITGQSLVNIAVVLGLLPVVGVPLPLVSYGGSSLIPTLAALGMLMSFARHEVRAKGVKARSG